MQKLFINIKDKRWNQYKIDFNSISRACNAKGKISITLTNDVELCALNKKYRGIDKPTNVLSFESGDSELLGDIFISFDTAMQEIIDEEKNNKNQKFIEHATHLVVHGILHLQGYDHLRRLQAWKMERCEVKILRKLGILNPYKIKPARASRSFFKVKWILQKAGLFALGAAAALGFAPTYFWWATVLSLGIAYHFNRGYKTGFWWGAGYGLVTYCWSLESIYATPELTAQFWYFYPIGMIALALTSGIVFGLPFWMTRITGSTGWRRIIYFSLAWTFMEWLREWFLTGCPWNPLATITLGNMVFSNLTPIVGGIGLTFILVGAMVSFWEKARLKFLFFLPLILSIFMPEKQIGTQNIKIRIVQPAFGMDQKMDVEQAEKNIKKLMELSLGNSADMVIWPETAYPFWVGEHSKMPAIGTKLVTGAVYYDFGKKYNALIVADGKGNILDKYFKHHLVPFGEYRPLGDWIPTPGQLEAGEGAKIIDNFAPAICYEIIFSDSLLPKQTSAGSPKFILNITNDVWFGRSFGPFQHLDLARLQAIETGLPVVRANYGGISAIIDARGRVVSSLPLGEQGILDGVVPASYISIYRQIGLHNMMLIIAIMCGIVLFGANFYRAKRE